MPKRIHIIAMVVLCLAGGWGAGAESDEAATYRFLRSIPEGVDWLSVVSQPTACVVRVCIPQPAISTNGGELLVDLPTETAFTNPGEPRLPILVALLELGEGIEAVVTTETGSPVALQAGYVSPVKSAGLVSLDDSRYEAREFKREDPGIYGHDAFWPQVAYTVNEAVGGGHRYLRLGMNAFRYNPVSRMLECHTNMTFRITFTQSGGASS